MTAPLQPPWDAQTFTGKLREVGSAFYHDKHPFHILMNSGRLAREAVQVWVSNRFYYQSNIPIKDAAILSNCPVREVRRIWIHRIVDHDGAEGDAGGIGAWLRLGEACGLARQELLDGSRVVPAARFAVDAYVHFSRTQPWPIAVASSLTELFAPDLMARRLEAFETFYKWVRPEGLEYFKSRLTQARRDSDEALQLTLTHCATLEMQEAAVRALQFKCDLLWALLDAIHQKMFLGSTLKMLQIDDQSVPALAPGVRRQKDAVSGEPVLVFPEGVLFLNPTAQEIVGKCDGTATVARIISELAEEYEAADGEMRNDVLECLGELVQRKLVTLTLKRFK